MSKMRINIKIKNVLCIRNTGKVALTEKTMISCQNEMRLKELFHRLTIEPTLFQTTLQTQEEKGEKC